MLKTFIANCLIGSVALIGFNAFAANTYFEARNDAMGGTGVASSKYGTAPLANPALLARHSGINFFSLIVPNIGTEVASKGGQELELDLSPSLLFNNFNKNNSLFTGALKNDVTDTQVDAKFGTSAVLAVPLDFLSFDLFSVALMAKAYGQTSFVGTLSTQDVDAVLNNQQITGASTSKVAGKAALVQEIGASFAKSTQFAGSEWGFGLTPKYQCLKVWNGTESLKDYSVGTSSLAYSSECGGENAFNMDMGAYVDLLNLATFGVAVQNLIPREISAQTTVSQENSSTLNAIETYKIRRQITAGAALNYKLVNFALDFDLTPTSGFKTDRKRQYASLGAELNVFFMQIRAGYRYNLLSDSNLGLADDIDEVIKNQALIRKGNKVITAGLGLPGLDLAYAFDQDTLAHSATAQIVIAF